MIDSQILRKNIYDLAKTLEARNFFLDVEYFLELDNQRKSLQSKTELLQAKRNESSKKIGILKSKGVNINELLKDNSGLGDEINILEDKLSTVRQKIMEFNLMIPNIFHKTVPIGKSEVDNEVLKEVGKIPNFDFKIKDHLVIGEKLGLDFFSGVKLTGSRFAVLKGGIARLHRALAQFMLDIHIKEHGYIECYTPYIVKSNSLIGTGQLPKFEEDLFSVKKGGEDKDQEFFYLIPTAEVTLSNLVRDEILNLNQLPLKLVAHSPCFRSEAGSYGKDTKGLIRQHQFDKVEMVQISHPEKSYIILEEMLNHAENILKKLDLPYRVINLCTGDIGFGAAKTYDLEVWLPGQEAYREISSISNCESFQARRMQARFRDKNGKIDLLHTLNGSGLAVGRTLVAIIENYQKADGSIKIPEAIIPYMNGEEFLSQK